MFSSGKHKRVLRSPPGMVEGPEDVVKTRLTFRYNLSWIAIYMACHCLCQLMYAENGSNNAFVQRGILVEVSHCQKILFHASLFPVIEKCAYSLVASLLHEAHRMSVDRFCSGSVSIMVILFLLSFLIGNHDPTVCELIFFCDNLPRNPEQQIGMQHDRGWRVQD